MTPAEACAVLGVAQSDELEEIHQVYKGLMLASHPDVVGVASDTRAREVTQAFAALRLAHEVGDLPVTVAPEPEFVPVELSDTVYLQLPGDDPFLQLLDAAHRLGEITYQDRDAGLFMVLLDESDEATCQLTGEITVGDGVTMVQFSLEPMGPGEVPSIETIVRRFGALSRTD